MNLDEAKATIDNWSSKTLSTKGGIYTLTRAAWLVLQELRRLEAAAAAANGGRGDLEAVRK
jgi:hypothetical protein